MVPLSGSIVDKQELGGVKLLNSQWRHSSRECSTMPRKPPPGITQCRHHCQFHGSSLQVMENCNHKKTILQWRDYYDVISLPGTPDLLLFSFSFLLQVAFDFISFFGNAFGCVREQKKDKTVFCFVLSFCDFAISYGYIRESTFLTMEIPFLLDSSERSSYCLTPFFLSFFLSFFWLLPFGLL